MPPTRVAKTGVIAPAVEAESGSDDDMDRGGCEIELARATDSEKARLDRGRRPHLEPEGRSVSQVDEQILEVVAPVARRHRAGRRLVAAAWTVERDRWSTRIDSPVPPRLIRRALFSLAAERSREEALATAAAELELSTEQIEAFLFADRERARVLVAPDERATTSDLLARATEITATIRANLRRVVGYAKLLGLMAMFDEGPMVLRG